MKLTLVFQDGRGLIFKPITLTKHATSIREEDIQREVRVVKQENPDMEHYTYVGCLEGSVKKFEPMIEFKL